MYKTVVPAELSLLSSYETKRISLIQFIISIIIIEMSRIVNF